MSRILTIITSLAIAFMAALAFVSPAYAVTNIAIDCDHPIASGDYFATEDVEFTTDNCHDVRVDGRFLNNYSTFSVPYSSLDAIDDPNGADEVEIDFFDANNVVLHLEIYKATASSNGNNSNSNNTNAQGNDTNQNPAEVSDVTQLLAQTGHEETLLFLTASLAVFSLVAGTAVISFSNRTRSKGIHNA